MKYAKTKRRSRLSLLICACAVGLILLGFLLSHALSPDAEASTHVSPALSVLAEQNPMAMAAMVGSPISFEADDFARALNLSSVTSITVTELPPVTDGELRVGSTVLTRGHTVSGSDLSLLSYHPKSGVTKSSFRFQVKNAPYEMTCLLYHLNELNHAPTLNMAPKTSLNVSTHRNVTLYGTLSCYDPDGDETVIEIVSYPEHGLLHLEDAATGAYTFIPGEDFAGKDSFIYVARDRYGNYSASATVSLTVVKPTSSVVYRDILDQPCYNAALTMTEEGIMSGKVLGLDSYFEPDRTVSRAEFTVMAMKAMGMTEVTAGEQTVFADDKEIAESARGYIAAAYELGYIKGLYRDDILCFEPNRAITRAEAAVMLGNMLEAATPTISPVFSDAATVPTWAAPSLSSLAAMGIIQAENGNIDALSTVTRADAAQILTNLMQSVK